VTAQRVTWAEVERLAARLSARDWRLVGDLARVRVATGSQLTRLQFHDLSPLTRDRVRRRVLTRLNNWHVVTMLERAVGGVRAGSAGAVYALGTAGQRLSQLAAANSLSMSRVRRPWTPSALFLNHSLAVAELYVQLIERTRSASFTVSHFEAEPMCWWPNGLGGFVKPDAFLVLSSNKYDELAWLEVDRGTESLPTVKRKLNEYLDFVARGQLGPRDVQPYVVVTTPDTKRRDALRQLVASLPHVPEELFTVVRHDEATDHLNGLAVVVCREPP